MYANHAVYKGYRLSAHVHHAGEQAGQSGTARDCFEATVNIVALGGAPAAGLPPLRSHRASSPREAIEAAVAYGRDVIDGLSSFTKGKRKAAAATAAKRASDALDAPA